MNRELSLPVDYKGKELVFPFSPVPQGYVYKFMVYLGAARKQKQSYKLTYIHNLLMENEGATVVITHHILDGKQQEYEGWLNEIGPVCRNATGNIDWQIIRPIPALTFAYTVIIRFDSIANLRKWMDSAERKNWIKKAAALFAKDDKYYIRTGLDFLFQSDDQNTKTPVRWKQYVATWSAIYPLSLLIPLIILPLLRKLNVAQNRYVDSLFISALIVFLMVYVVMPPYTRLIKKWLYG